MTPSSLEPGLRAGDPAAIAELLGSTGFFSPAEIAIAVELAEAGLKAPDGDYRFIVCRRDGRLAGFACFGHVAGSRGSWDLYWISVAGALQRRGTGRQLIAAVEKEVLARAGRLVWVETSARAQYTPTRRFYESCGYSIAATLADFYAPGEDKLILRKVLGA